MYLHKRSNIEKVIQILDWYENKTIKLDEALGMLGLKRRQFFNLLAKYRTGELKDLKPIRSNTHLRLPQSVDDAIRSELNKEKQLIENKDIAIKFYNYQAVRDEVVSCTGRIISAQTVRNRAKAWGYYIERPIARKHTRVVQTTASGMLLQHDASIHLYAPYAGVKYVLITTLDDYSRMLLFADLFEEESSWAHIEALEAVITKYGVGGNYYTDNHSIFRFTSRAETYFRKSQKDPKEIKTQWEQCVRAVGMDIIYATSPEAKGKIERPYRWLQDRLTRACIKANVKDINGTRELLKAEVRRYNQHQIHSTTGEIPLIRFNKSKQQNETSVFRPFILPTPYTSAKDIFCLREERKIDGYNQISWRGSKIKLERHLPEGATVKLHIIPGSSNPEIRIWYKGELVQSVSFKPTNLNIPSE